MSTAARDLDSAERILVELGHQVVARSLHYDTAAIPENRAIWMFWGGPLPAHLAACIGKIDELSGESPVIVVDPTSARRFAPELPAAWDDLESWAHRSDVLAPHLLRRYGGLYLDVDTVAVAPLDPLIDELESGDHDYVAYLNAHGRPSVGVMWSRVGSSVARTYCELLDAKVTDDVAELGWLSLGSPLLAEAFEQAGVDHRQLPAMLGRVALVHWPAWRTLLAPYEALQPLLRLFDDDGASLVLVALFHSRSGDALAERRTRTIFDELLAWRREAPRPSGPHQRQVTFMIKTFNRPATVTHAVEAVRRRWPDHDILVVDDSADEHLADLAEFEVAHLIIEFDAGLSRGRNIGITHISSDYVVMMDDDQFPAPDLDLAGAIAAMEAMPTVDAAGGWEDETPHVRDSFELEPGGVLVQRRHTPWRHLEVGADSVPLFHMVQNQTLWRRASFTSKGLRWSPDLKVGEHVDFFFRYRGQVNIIFLPELHFANVPGSVRARDEATTEYHAYRNRQKRMWKRFKAKHDIVGIDVRNHALPEARGDHETALRAITRAGFDRIRARVRR